MFNPQPPTQTINLKVKSTGAIIALVLVLSSLSLLTYLFMKESVAKLSSMIEVTVMANNLKVLSGTATEGLPAEIEDYALHPSDFKEKNISATFEEIKNQIEKIEERLIDAEGKIQLQLVRNMFTSYHEGFLQIRSLIKSKSKFSLAVEEISNIKENSILINEAIQKFISEELSRQRTEKESQSKAIAKNGMLLVVTIFLSALLAIITFYYFIIYKSIISPLQSMKETMQKISTNASDIKLRVHTKSDDEIGSLAIFFNQMADTIQKYNEHLEEIVNIRTKQLNEAQAMLMQSSKLSALGEMAGGIAHEINTPLAVISMRVEQLEAIIHELKDDEKINKADLLKFTDVVGKTSGRISKIVSGLKSFARDGSKDPLVKTSVTDLIKDSLSFCSEKFLNHGIVLNVESHFGPKGDPFIQCRQVEISQVVINLLNNSFDAIQDLPEQWIKVACEDAGDFVLISVIDSGKGIPNEIQNKIMQPFFTTKDIGKGTGLGLSISKGIIESHSGSLFVDNTCPNTKISIRLPKASSL
jgi:C4-dicarboxylate-specific signal transduction histidine kinase